MDRESRIYLNDGWMFTTKYSNELLERECGLPMEEVRLPHSGIDLPYHYFEESLYQMDMGYRRVFVPEKAWEDKHVFLTIM